jgi:hypothetical protein
MEQERMGTHAYICEMHSNIEELSGRLEQQDTEWSVVVEVERMRERMREQTRSEMEKI